MSNQKRNISDVGSEEPQQQKKPKLGACYKLNANFALDVAHQTKNLKKVITLPPSALQGITEEADVILAQFTPAMETIKDLANFKYFQVARAIKTMAEVEENGKRAINSEMNINNALDQEYEPCNFNDMLDLPVEALQGIGKVFSKNTTDKISGTGRLKTIRDLAEYKYARWAEALTTLAEYQTDNFTSKTFLKN